MALGDGRAGGFKKDQGPGVQSRGGREVRWKRNVLKDVLLGLVTGSGKGI